MPHTRDRKQAKSASSTAAELIVNAGELFRIIARVTNTNNINVVWQTVSSASA